MSLSILFVRAGVLFVGAFSLSILHENGLVVLKYHKEQAKYFHNHSYLNKIS